MTAAETPNHIWVPCYQCDTGNVEVNIDGQWALVICGVCEGGKGWWFEPTSMSVGLKALQKYVDTRDERIQKQVDLFRALAKREGK